MNFDKENFFYLARISEQGERYEEMIDFVKQMTKDQYFLNTQERNLLSTAYKNAASKIRNSLRIVQNYEIPENSSNFQSKTILLEKYRLQVHSELKNLCFDAIETVKNLLNNIEDNETKVFLYKMKADYYRYMCEYDKGEIKDFHTMKAEEFYQKALELGLNLPANDPLKLGLQLNYSVFLCEIKKCKEQACEIANKVLFEAMAEENEANGKESALILQVFKENLLTWS